LIFQWNFCGVKNTKHSIHYFRTNSISFSNGNFFIFMMKFIKNTKPKCKI
jgi:hypothetical protein